MKHIPRPELQHLVDYFSQQAKRAAKNGSPTKAYTAARCAAHHAILFLNDNPTLFDSAPPGRLPHRVFDPAPEVVVSP